MQPFVINRHGKLSVELHSRSGFLGDRNRGATQPGDPPRLRDQSPVRTEIGLRIEQGKYKDRVALMRDVALKLWGGNLP